MKILSHALLTFGVAALSLPAFAQSAASTDGPFHVTRTLHIGGEGGFDYLTVDPDHHLLYVPRSTHTMVLDENDGKLVADIPGQRHNHGVAIAPDAGRGFITDGSDASVTVFDLKTHQVLGKIKAAEDADGIIYDPASKKVLVSCGDANVMLAIDPAADPNSAKAESVELGGKPEFLAADGKGKAYVNLEDKNEVAVVDLKQMKVLQRYPVAPGGSPVGMAIDRDHHRLFVGCRKPQKLVVMDADSGKVLADLPIGAGVDATQFDNGYAFASCRDGTLAVAHESSRGKFDLVQTVATPPGAKTMGLDSNTHTLYLPTAEMQQGKAGGKARPTPKPGTFMVVVVEPKSR